jgi:hypothetical protein
MTSDIRLERLYLSILNVRFGHLFRLTVNKFHAAVTAFGFSITRVARISTMLHECIQQFGAFFNVNSPDTFNDQSWHILSFLPIKLRINWTCYSVNAAGRFVKHPLPSRILPKRDARWVYDLG